MNERTLAGLISIVPLLSQPRTVGAPAVDHFHTASVVAQGKSAQLLGMMP